MHKKRFACSSLLMVSVTIAAPLFAAGLTQKEQLGKIMYQDKDFSYNSTQSCQTCHHRTAGFADPTNMRDPATTVVSTGADGVSKGGRNAPSSAYAGFSPVLEKIIKADGSYVYVGGLFWDGHATGTRLGDPLAEQAQGPPLNTVEMNMPSKEAVVEVVRTSSYASLFKKVFGRDALEDTDTAWDHIATAIAAYERSPEVQAFSSRFDRGQLTMQEQRGKALFADKCAQCHPMDTVGGAKGPLFTNATYANLGLPANTEDGVEGGDLGLGGFLAASGVNPDEAVREDGKFKVPTLRNVALTAPYGHNGYFATLREMVQFLNSSDSWPAPDVDRNVTAAVGDLGLTDAQIDDLVAFLLALTDQ
jgi:cytochrome c peroxidase